MEVDKQLGGDLKQEPQLSGAYIRNLVKQLTSSRTKESMSSSSSSPKGDCQSMSGENPNPSPNPKPQKKQVRRRLHTSRPYQERLLNMAEARREIVTALKFHRAAMKQVNEQKEQQQHEHEHGHHQQPLLQVQPPPPQQCYEPEGKIKSRRNPRIYPSSTETSYYSSIYLENPSYGSLSYPPQIPPPPTPAYPFHWSTPGFPTSVADFPLPNQPLGLNLNFHDFTNLDTTLYQTNFPSSSSSSSPPLTEPSQGGIITPAALLHQPHATGAESDVAAGLHQVMDDEEMAEMRSLGDQHQMEWNDTMNLVTSACWSKFLKTMEIDPDEVKAKDIESSHPFDEVMELPAWLNPSDVCFQQQFEGYSSHDPDLPCMDIGDIDGMDGDWLS